MSLIETESLILRTYNLGDADKIVVCLTRDHGIVRGVAKGAKRLKSRFGSSLEPFSQVRLTYFQKENIELVSIDKVEITRSVFDAMSDPELLQKFSYFSELLISFLPPHDPNEAMYRLARACIEQGISHPARLADLDLYFKLWLLRLTGYLPDWSRCSDCRRVLDDREDADVQANFQLLCQNCRRSNARHSIGPDIRELVSGVMQLSPAVFAAKGIVGDPQLLILAPILQSIISASLGRDILQSSGAESSALRL